MSSFINESHMSYDCHTPLMLRIGEVDFSSFDGEIWGVTGDLEKPYIGYDDWLSHFPREGEIGMLARALQEVRTNSKRIHIMGVSTAESVELLREYYAECGYEDTLAKSYILPSDTLLTVSISLSHVLWCAKDKILLNSGLAPSDDFLGKIVPPLRGASDLRSLQQGLRMGIIMGITVTESESEYLDQIFEKQIVSPFLLAQCTYFRWIRHGFSVIQRERVVRLPDFSQLRETRENFA